MISKTFIWFLCLFSLTVIFIAPTRSAVAQTEPAVTPQEGYPPPATPSQPESGYPAVTVAPLTAIDVDEGYIAPTVAAPSPTIAALLGSEAASETETAASTIPISQSSLARNRAILWAGFIITLLIFLIAVYGAMLMYTRRRN